MHGSLNLTGHLRVQGNGIIKKLQAEVRGLVGKIKVKNTVTVSQERVLKDTSDRLQAVEKELENSQKQLLTKEEQVGWTQMRVHVELFWWRIRAAAKAHSGSFFLWTSLSHNLVFQVLKLKDQLETTVQKLNESKEVLKTNENGETPFVSAVSFRISAVNKITGLLKNRCFTRVRSEVEEGLPSLFPPTVINWLNKQLNEKQLSATPPKPLDNPSLLTTGLRVPLHPTM